ncbi:Hypothetical predicted protein [Octopus vulgaris]|uniref:Uncharacterized protein n=1 Tax=Octopus vulgaris TaxID=6645 RepID=A0AA36AF64_OCTVU|nr:Hypothetical predicted protein [Octopus vulgaris]
MKEIGGVQEDPSDYGAHDSSNTYLRTVKLKPLSLGLNCGNKSCLARYCSPDRNMIEIVFKAFLDMTVVYDVIIFVGIYFTAVHFVAVVVVDIDVVVVVAVATLVTAFVIHVALALGQKYYMFLSYHNGCCKYKFSDFEDCYRESNRKLDYINQIHRSYDTFYYLLLFPCEYDGWNVLLTDNDRSKNGDEKYQGFLNAIANGNTNDFGKP